MMKEKQFRIGLAAVKHPDTIEHAIEKIDGVLGEGAERKVKIVCFPETYIPGLRGFDLNLPAPNQKAQEAALAAIRRSAKRHGVAAIVGMEWMSELGLHNRAYVVSAAGRALGYQTKNQITPGGESMNYVPDGERRVFSVNGVKFGIVICHEGWRYPETVRWAVTRGAVIVFQPQVTGSDKSGRILKTWGESFYERAMMCRSEENSIYFASVNTAMRFQNSATSLIDPSGKCVDYVPCGKEKLMIADLDLSKATRRYAKRYRPEWYPE